MDDRPNQFLEVRVHDNHQTSSLIGLCAGYELGRWRSSQLASHLIEWLPDFALNFTERQGLRSNNAVALLARAASVVYSSDKYQKRGELGEILLHIAVRQVFDAIPAVSKVYYKDTPNDTVKGFDSVHIVASPNSLQLWLGEAKFYEDIKPAIRDAVQSINAHSQRDYLRTEFIAIVNKLDPTWPHVDKLRMLLDKNNSLDKIFESLCIPVFLTYDSPVIVSHREVTDAFKSEFINEVRTHHDTFSSNNLPPRIVIHLFLLPLGSKRDLVKEFDERLKACQSMLR